MSTSTVAVAVLGCAVVAAIAFSTCGRVDEPLPSESPVRDAKSPLHSTSTTSNETRRPRTHAVIPEEEPATAPVAAKPDVPPPPPTAEELERFGQHVYEVMDNLIAAKAAERVDPNDPPPDPSSGVPTKGTLAAARQWESRELHRELWDTLNRELRLNNAALDKRWKDRPRDATRTATYTVGSFIVVKKAPANGAPRVRAAKTEKPITEEKWWAGAPTDERAKWLTANFVESSGMFEVLKCAEDPCPGCGGSGDFESTDDGGAPILRRCPTCNGAGKVRTATYR